MGVAVVVGCAQPAQRPAETPATVERTPPAARSEPDQDMQVSGTLGTLSEEEIEAPFRSHWSEVSGCYAAVRPQRSYLGGRIDLKVRIDQFGKPQKAFVAASTLGNYRAERCLLEIARALQFTAPHGGPEAEFTYPIEFRADRPPTTWDAERVSPVLVRHKKDLAGCKAKAQAGLPSSVQMTLYVAPGGRVASCGLSADAPLDELFASCIVERSQSWRLDDPLGKIAKATVGVLE